MTEQPCKAWLISLVISDLVLCTKEETSSFDDMEKLFKYCERQSGTLFAQFSLIGRGFAKKMKITQRF